LTDLNRRENEIFFEWKLRCCLAKKRGETDMDWIEIRDMLGLNITPDQLRKIAVGYAEYDDYLNGNSGVATTILSISDLHIPFQKPLETFEKYAGKIDVLQLNGDLIDCMALSRFTKTFRVSPVEEMIVCRQYLIDLITMIRPKKVLANDGNHEIRLGATLAKNLDNELQELMPESALEYIFMDGFTHYDRKTHAKTKYAPLCEVFDDIDVEYTGTWYSQYKDVIFCHPKAFCSNPMKTAEKALYWFRNEGHVFRSLIMSHTHRLGSYKIGNSMIYEQGCCCDTSRMRYNDGQLINSQKEGYIVVCLDKDGHVIEEKTKIVSLN
jgi:hypothetical protein